MASDGAKGSNYAHSFVSVTSSRCEPNTTPFCASTQALVPWSDTKCRQPFRCFILLKPGQPRPRWMGLIGELKQRRRRRQRERQKAKQQLCTCSTLFCTFFCRHCTTTTWKCLISRFVENVNTRQRLYSILEFNSRKNWQYLTSWTRWNKRDKVWSSVNSPFNWRFRSRSCRCCLNSVMT